MRPQLNLKVKNKYAKQYKNGFPLIQKQSLINWNELKEEGTLVKLVDEQNQFLGKGYYGNQNKGYGWVVSSDPQEMMDVAFFKNTLQKAIQKRSALMKSEETNAFRLFNGEGDGIGGFTIDYFDGFLVINWYSHGIYSFNSVILEALEDVMNYRGIYEKKRFLADGKYMDDNDYVTGQQAPSPLIIKENGVNFAVHLNDGAMVGIFLDQREVRKTIRDKYSQGKTVLNTFSYTGAFSVYAALGGAKKTTSVDLAKRSLPKTIEQFQVNNIDDKTQSILVEEVFHYFKYAKRKNLKFDVVIMDPPSFARSKKVTFRAEKDYTSLVSDAIAITEKNGLIVASTNASTFGMDKFKGFIDLAFKQNKQKYKIVEEFSLPSDFATIKQFKEGNYLKVLFIKVVG
ncbi:class I SAM-dependent rRNA methyltransferase [Sutcliffiella rhizosphaerae]|uniref:Ribosomal RNA large subunit methyltransferase I n=1 Tax=Sutcliffiella rhizosphaerae TaxID=2880967 RepID=A0ABM8YKG1_9BACI|nr:class I SAM-dependent rRNA methyltransferase [Sutcliffiella rhizosphaerae]CAG9620426.1 Ribosomal RNA large subunit methyltransferase I [Sutcliffiella rhizosphaerae]